MSCSVYDLLHNHNIMQRAICTYKQRHPLLIFLSQLKLRIAFYTPVS